MRPRYCCFYLRQELQIGFLHDAGGKRVIVMLPSGEALRKRPSDLLWRWLGTPIPETGSDAARQVAALEQLRENAAPPPNLARWLDQLHAALAGEAPRPFERILEDDPTTASKDTSSKDSATKDTAPGDGPPAARTPGGEDQAITDGETAWRQAHLFMGLLRDARRFRYLRGAISARPPEEIAAWEARQAEAEEQERWNEQAAEWGARLDASIPLPEGHPDTEAFLTGLRSLLALEKRSPHWGVLARPLGLHRLGPEDLGLRVKSWLKTAGVWPDWPAIWLDWGEVPTAFAPGLEDAVHEMVAAPVRTTGRKDFTGTEAYSIDSAETRDIDDALSILDVGKHGMTVAVHIAEPDPALEPGHPLFDEAARRMATAYTLSGIYPMFPEPLSQVRFSLLAGALRETLTFVLQLREGNAELLEVVRGFVNLSGNLDYIQTQTLLDAHPGSWGKLATHCAELAQARARRGAILMERKATRLDISDPEHIRISEVVRTGPVHQIVEEMAIAYNAASGGYCRTHDLPAIYRVQPVSPQGLSAPPDQEDARPAAPPARFTTQPERHTGLGCERYIQTTSPIRRFLDLVMQRQIATHADGGGTAFTDIKGLEAWAIAADGRMGQIDDTARRIEEDWKRRYLLQHSGALMDATVRRKDGATGRVWLEPLRMTANCEFPEGTCGADMIRVRVTSVDRDRRQVWCRALN